MKIIELFPQTVGQFNLDRSLTNDELESLQGKDVRIGFGGNAVTADSYILKDPKLKDLKSFIDKCVAEYAECTVSPNDNVSFRVTQSWVTYTKKGQHHQRHFHANSVISGVFYIKTDSEKDKIHFYKDKLPHIAITPKKLNYFNTYSWWLPSLQGTLYLFPSSLEHSVEAVENDDVRIALAFNTFPVGTIGNQIELSELLIL